MQFRQAIEQQATAEAAPEIQTDKRDDSSMREIIRRSQQSLASAVEAAFEEAPAIEPPKADAAEARGPEIESAKLADQSA